MAAAHALCEQRVSGEKLPEPASHRSAGRSRHDSNVRHPASKAGALSCLSYGNTSGRTIPGAKDGIRTRRVLSTYRSRSTATGDTATGTLSERDRCRASSRTLFVRDVLDGLRHRQDLNLRAPGEATLRLDGRHVRSGNRWCDGL